MKERFSTDEWAVLTLMPGMVLHMVVLSDGEASEAEMKVFSRELGSPEATKNPLHRQLLESFAADAKTNFEASLAAVEDIGRAFAVCDQILTENLTGKERQSFLASLMLSALLMARADGVHPNEQEVFAAFGEAFQVEPQALQDEMDLYE